jgi:hypothetical protein
MHRPQCWPGGRHGLDVQHSDDARRRAEGTFLDGESILAQLKERPQRSTSTGHGSGSVIAIGLYAQTKEILAVHTAELSFRPDTGTQPTPRLDAWNAWASERGVEGATATSVAVEVVLDTPAVTRVMRVRPDSVRWRFQTA